jgi:hypothetical protein
MFTTLIGFVIGALLRGLIVIGVIAMLALPFSLLGFILYKSEEFCKRMVSKGAV